MVPLQAVVQNGDDHTFARDAFLPHGNHVQVQFGEGGRGPGVLLEGGHKEKDEMYKEG